MIRRPGPADGDFAILQLLGGTAVAILVFLDGFRLNQVSNIDQHAAGIHPLAANLFLKRIEHFMYLDGQGPCLGLALGSRDAFSLSLIKYSPPTVSGSMTFSRAA